MKTACGGWRKIRCASSTARIPPWARSSPERRTCRIIWTRARAPLSRALANIWATRTAAPPGYLVLPGAETERQGMVLAERLRDAGLRIECNCGGGALKAQFKRADRSGARHALLLGDEGKRNGPGT